MLVAVAGGATLLAATTPLHDGDLYWHLEVGRQILSRHTVHGLGSDWSFASPGLPWTTTQWLSEVILTAIHRAAGMRGLLLLRLVVSAILVVGLWRLLVRGRDAFWGSVVFALTLLALAPFLEERPQLASFPLLVWLSGVAWRTLQIGRAPPLWSTLAVTFLWANLHGLWVLVPFTLAVLAGGALLDCRHDLFGRLALTAAACVSVACLTPVGPALLLSPARFAAATQHIAEWQPTVPRNPASVTLDIAVLLFVLAWARSRSAVPRSEVLFVLSFLGFALLAFRNTAPAAILLAPVLVHRLQASFPQASRSDSARERRIFVATAVLVSVTCLLAAAVRVATISPVSSQIPNRLVALVAADGQRHRVLNDFNVGGVLIHAGPGREQVAVDGRADYYGARRITQHLRLIALRPGWRERLVALNPDRALLERDAPLTDQLRLMGWDQLGEQGKYVLLAR